MKNTKRSGFTLLEVLIVIATIGILAVVLMPSFAPVRTNARRSTCGQNMGQIHKAITMYETDFETFPTRAAKGKDPCTDGDAQEALNLLYRAYTDDVRIFSCPSRPLSPKLINSVLPSTASSWPGPGVSFKEAAPGVSGYSTSYGYSPGHNSNNSRVIILADRQGTGSNGYSDNHGWGAGQNVLSAGGSIEFRSGKDARRNSLGKDETETEVIDSDIFSMGTITPAKYSEWDSYCR